MNYPENTESINISENGIDKIIGQDKAIKLAKIAASQKRNLFLIGQPGTGKSMIAKSIAEILKKESVPDLVSFRNDEDQDNPIINSFQTGKAQEIVQNYKQIGESKERKKKIIFSFPILIWITVYISNSLNQINFDLNSFFLLSLVIICYLFLYFLTGAKISIKDDLPLVLKSNEFEFEKSIFIDATGSEIGGLLGDVKHDPYQSGGLETPPHRLVQLGAIHKAHKGVLFIDEIASLSYETQISILTAMQEKKFPIYGKSKESSSSLIRSNPVDCDFILVAAGNFEVLDNLHPAFRSRLRGNGFEIILEESCDDTYENRYKYFQFVAQEVIKTGNIPHFSQTSVSELINIAKSWCKQENQISLRFRELGGIVRTAGDLARLEGSSFVEIKHINEANSIFKNSIQKS